MWKVYPVPETPNPLALHERRLAVSSMSSAMIIEGRRTGSAGGSEIEPDLGGCDEPSAKVGEESFFDETVGSDEG